MQLVCYTGTKGSREARTLGLIPPAALQTPPSRWVAHSIQHMGRDPADMPSFARHRASATVCCLTVLTGLTGEHSDPERRSHLPHPGLRRHHDVHFHVQQGWPAGRRCVRFPGALFWPVTLMPTIRKDSLSEHHCRSLTSSASADGPQQGRAASTCGPMQVAGNIKGNTFSGNQAGNAAAAAVFRLQSAGAVASSNEGLSNNFEDLSPNSTSTTVAG